MLIAQKVTSNLKICHKYKDFLLYIGTAASDWIKKSNLFTPCALKTPRLQVAKYLQEINLFEITIVRDLHRKDFDEIVDTLSDYKNKGWIKFEIPTVTQYGSDSNTPSETEDEIDDDMKYFQSLADSDAREIRV
jgi:hypothetical protein